jgi:predicted RNA-binding protein
METNRKECDKKLFCYAKANTMIGHKFNDDVALCRAENLEEAINILSNYYSLEILEGNVREIDFDTNKVYVATDY